jgi:hypothetical protein
VKESIDVGRWGQLRAVIRGTNGRSDLRSVRGQGRPPISVLENPIVSEGAESSLVFEGSSNPIEEPDFDDF